MKYSYNVNGVLYSPTETQMKSPSFVSLLNTDGDYFYPDYTNTNDIPNKDLLDFSSVGSVGSVGYSPAH